MQKYNELRGKLFWHWLGYSHKDQLDHLFSGIAYYMSAYLTQIILPNDIFPKNLCHSLGVFIVW